MEFAQMHVGADRADFERQEDLFGGRLDDDQVTDGIERLVFGRPAPAFLG